MESCRSLVADHVLLARREGAIKRDIRKYIAGFIEGDAIHLDVWQSAYTNRAIAPFQYVPRSIKTAAVQLSFNA